MKTRSQNSAWTCQDMKGKRLEFVNNTLKANGCKNLNNHFSHGGSVSKRGSMFVWIVLSKPVAHAD